MNIMAQLTRREREVARLLAQGLTQRQIARRLGIKHGTCYRHTDNIRRKTGMTTIAVAVKVAGQQD